MTGGNKGSCTVSLLNFCPVVMDVLLVCTFVAGSSLEKLSTGRLVGDVMQSNRQTGKILSWGSYIALIGACVSLCHLAFASKRLGVYMQSGQSADCAVIVFVTQGSSNIDGCTGSRWTQAWAALHRLTNCSLHLLFWVVLSEL